MKFLKLCCITIVLFGLQSCRKASNFRRQSQTHVEKGDEQGWDQRKRKNESPQKEEKVKRQTPNNRKYDGTTIFKKYNSAVFMVFTSDGMNGYQGSGFFINNKGLAVSNYHIFKGTGIGSELIKLVGSDTPYKVTKVIAKSKENDFIIFKVNVSKSNYIPLAKEKPKIGEKVYAISSPRGLENTFSSGGVSQWRDTYLMQINVLIDHGSSGGALINEYGEVVAITSGSFYDGSQANLNYAWSIESIKPFINNTNQQLTK